MRRVWAAMSLVDRALGALAALASALYRFLISSRLPPVCIYHPSCSHYAHLAWMRWGLVQGTRLTRDRLRRCTGGTYAGEDWPPGVAPCDIHNRALQAESRATELAGQRAWPPLAPEAASLDRERAQ